jgi:hypothetical protein
MPKALEAKLRREAAEKFSNIKDREKRKEKMDAYVYGTLRSTGWRPKREKH